MEVSKVSWADIEDEENNNNNNEEQEKELGDNLAESILLDQDQMEMDLN